MHRFKNSYGSTNKKQGLSFYNNNNGDDVESHQYSRALNCFLWSNEPHSFSAISSYNHQLRHFLSFVGLENLTLLHHLFARE